MKESRVISLLFLAVLFFINTKNFYSQKNGEVEGLKVFQSLDFDSITKYDELSFLATNEKDIHGDGCFELVDVYLLNVYKFGSKYTIPVIKSSCNIYFSSYALFRVTFSEEREKLKHNLKVLKQLNNRGITKLLFKDSSEIKGEGRYKTGIFRHDNILFNSGYYFGTFGRSIELGDKGALTVKEFRELKAKTRLIYIVEIRKSNGDILNFYFDPYHDFKFIGKTIIPINF